MEISDDDMPDAKTETSISATNTSTSRRQKKVTSYVDDTEDDSTFSADSDEKPNKKKKSSAPSSAKNSETEELSAEESDFEDVPLAQKKKQLAKAKITTKLKRKTKVVSSESDSDGVPLSKKIKKTSGEGKKTASAKSSRRSSASAKKEKVEKKEKAEVKKEKDEVKKEKAEVKKENGDAKVKKEKGKKKNEKSPNKKIKKEEGEGEEEEESEEYKWWLDENKDDSIKWNTLEHNGPLFPPLYIPHGVKMKYNGKPVDLSPDAEEVASFYAALIGTDHAENPTFRDNFFKDFLAICAKQTNPTCPIIEFSKCDFSPITEYLNEQREKKKQMSKEEKLKIKEEKAEIDKVYGWAYLNGRKEKVGNYRIEPPGLFRGRGAHPKTGSLKQRLTPEQVTINIGKEAKVPEPPAGHQWGKVIHDNSVTWLAMWKDNVNDSIKYVFLAANSSLKGQSDFKKFEKARGLKQLVDGIRASYTAELKDKVMAIRQRATAMYLIDRFALRAGNEKGEDEADTVGCCSLRFEHITLVPPTKVIFDFLGKDSIRYYNEVDVDEQVFKNLKIFKKEPKGEGDPLFDRLNTTILNKHLSTFMPGLTGKVFRTFNASFTFQQELQKTPADGTVQEKILAYNRANRQVAVLCNHQRSVPKGHGNQMGRIKEKIDILKYEKNLVKKCLLKEDPKLKKKRPELAEDESDYDDDTEKAIEELLKQQELDKLKKKLEKKNEKIKAGDKQDGDEILTEAQINKEIAAAAKTAGAPNMKEKIERLSLEKLEKKYDQIVERIRAQKMLQIDKEEGKTTALGTSKINYIDPRISVAWCYKYEVPIEKIFNASLREKFKWAMDLDKDWEF